MENYTLSLRDLAFLLGLIASLWAVVKIMTEIKKPHEELEEKVKVLERWHKEDHERLKEVERTEQLILESLLSLIEHEITGNGVEKFKELQHTITNYLIKEK